MLLPVPHLLQFPLFALVRLRQVLLLLCFGVPFVDVAQGFDQVRVLICGLVVAGHFGCKNFVVPLSQLQNSKVEQFVAAVPGQCLPVVDLVLEFQHFLCKFVLLELDIVLGLLQEIAVEGLSLLDLLILLFSHLVQQRFLRALFLQTLIVLLKVLLVKPILLQFVLQQLFLHRLVVDHDIAQIFLDVFALQLSLLLEIFLFLFLVQAESQLVFQIPGQCEFLDFFVLGQGLLDFLFHRIKVSD